MPKRFALFLLSLTLTAVACGEGDFDQRLRADVDELRDGALIFVNTNPGNGSGTIHGDVSTGGPVTFARVTAHAVDLNGVVDFSENTALGDTISAGARADFTITLRRNYEGPIIVSARPTEFNGKPTRYPSPANAAGVASYDLELGEELLGYVIDYPFIEDALIVSPLTTLVVEKAIHSGGVSSASLAIAARQIGAFFGLYQAREERGDNIVDETVISIETLELDMALASISQYAKDSGVRDAAVWSALRRDIRDDGELNGTAGLIDGSEVMLADFSQANFVGQSVLLRYLAPSNLNNRSGINSNFINTGSELEAVMNRLNAPRTLAQTTLTITDLVLLNPQIRLKAGQMTSIGVRGFERKGEVFYMVASSDGPQTAQIDITPQNPLIVDQPAPGYISVPLGTAAGSTTTISVRVRPDGVILTGAFDQTVTITLTVIP